MSHRPNAYLFCLLPSLFVRSGSPLNIHHLLFHQQRRRNLQQNISPFSPRWSIAYPDRRSHQALTMPYNYGVLNHHGDISLWEDMQNVTEAHLVYSYSCQNGRWEGGFVSRRIVIVTIDIYGSRRAQSRGSASEGDSGMHRITRRTRWNKALRQAVSSNKTF